MKKIFINFCLHFFVFLISILFSWLLALLLFSSGFSGVIVLAYPIIMIAVGVALFIFIRNEISAPYASLRYSTALGWVIPIVFVLLMFVSSFNALPENYMP